ncbi:MAG: hypothetical protein KJ626_15000 [Verrucomicrobia bacterium]|nr:hypothetical protein [Verrucomicrobiota bacterium]
MILTEVRGLRASVLYICVFLAIGGASVEGADYVVDFEDDSKGAYAAGEVTLNGKTWNFDNALIGSLVGDKKNGARSARLRHPGVITMQENVTEGIGSVDLYYARYGTDSDAPTMVLEYSTNEGVSWAQAGSSFSAAGVDVLTSYSAPVNVPGFARVRVRSVSGAIDDRANIDDLVVHDYASSGASNVPPVLAPIGGRSVIESNTLQFAVSASDPVDGDTVTLTMSNGPPGAVLGSTNGSGSFVWSPATPVGVYTTSFYAADVDGASSETIEITVNQDLTLVNFTSADGVLTETPGGQSYDFTIALSRPASCTLDVSLARSSAAFGSDFSITATTFVFSASGAAEQSATVTVFDDVAAEGPEHVTMVLTNFAGVSPGVDVVSTVSIRDNDAFLVMAANLSSQTGVCASTYNGPGTRLFKGLLPDVVAIQEFNVSDPGGHREFVDKSFGTNFHYFVESEGSCALPNGIISRWPITNSGEWADAEVFNRDFAWASIDLPGTQALHVISVHLKAGDLTSDQIERENEARALTNYIAQAGFPPEDFIVLAGDLNLASRSALPLAILTNVVSDNFKPADQFGDWDTNIPRNRPYDYVLANPLLDAQMLDVVINGYYFPDGAVFDSRLWIDPPHPILPDDSAAEGIQHLAVVKLFPMSATEVPPYLTPIGSRIIAENSVLMFSVSAQATDGDAVTLGVSNIPPGAVFSSTNENGSFTWDPATPAGTYTSLFYAADNDGIDTESVIIRVYSGGDVWINELHYDNDSIDTNEGVEVAGTAGTDLNVYTIYAYNGGDGQFYSSTVLSGVVDDEGCGYGAVWFDIEGLQNGGPDGLALVRGTSVVQFISYEGVMTASDGPANGMTSSDIGVDEQSLPAVGMSLQLQGDGTAYANFTWAGPTNAASRGLLNVAQAISGCAAGGGDVDADGMPDQWEVDTFGDTTTAGTNTDFDLDGFPDVFEFRAGTQATNINSMLDMSAQRPQTGSGYVVYWSSITNKTYEIVRSTNGPGAFAGIESNITATPPQNVYTDAVPPGAETVLYRVRLQD